MTDKEKLALAIAALRKIADCELRGGLWNGL